MGQPAARITDMHACPATDGPVPHAGGPILTGDPTVLIGGLPVARLGDTVTCVGPPATIIKGSSGVFIGGRPAARMGDQTSHGGVIVLGCPTVLIGETGAGAGGGGAPAPASAASASQVDNAAASSAAPASDSDNPFDEGAGDRSADGAVDAPDGPDGSYPEGLAYRLDLPKHLAGPNGFTSRGKLDGTHNLENAKSALEGRRAYQVQTLQKGRPGYTITPTSTHGISELSYQVRLPTSGVIKTDTKTMYDPAVHSDQVMLQLALKAGERAFTHYKANPSQTVIDLTQDGIKFRSYVKIDKKTRTAHIANVHPIR